MQITGNELFIKCLCSEGVETLFVYPGGKVITLFDTLYKQKDLQIVLPRHEQALVHAADGYARSTGRVGVCLVTSGPGATNIVTGLLTAQFDSAPIVCFTGQVPMGIIGNDAFQEADIVGITRSAVKHSVMVTKREDLGRIIKEAFYIAKTGKPGPVVVDLPVDIMNTLGSHIVPKTVNIRSYKPNTNVHIGQLKKSVNLLKTAKKPLFLAGGGINIADANEAFTQLVEKTGIPVVTTIMGKGAIPSHHPLYIGNLGMHGCFAANQAVQECDVLFSIGSRFNDRITGKLDLFAPFAKIVHIDIDTAAISRNIKVQIPIVADAKQAITELLNYVEPLEINDWVGTIEKWKNQHPLAVQKIKGLSPIAVMQKLNERFKDAIFVTDVGQNQMWAAQFLDIDTSKTFITSGGFGTMGFGFPAALGAQLGNKKRTVVCITGDGGFQMNLQELATAVIEQLPVITLIFNNGSLGMVRQWQQMFFGKRYSATDLYPNSEKEEGSEVPTHYLPDFVKLAESYGAVGIRVTKEEELDGALNEALKQTNKPTIIELIIDKDAIVLPIVRDGAPIKDMILEVEE